MQIRLSAATSSSVVLALTSLDVLYPDMILYLPFLSKDERQEPEVESKGLGKLTTKSFQFESQS